MHFVKMEGCGNDYIYLDGEKEAISNPQALARKISDRHFGVGADGMILICPSDTADCRMEMYNADGSRGSMCGNGVRCVARYLYDYKQIKKQEIAVETDSGIHTVRVLKDSEKGKVSMGRPVILDQSHIISLEGHSDFPDGVNVELVQVYSETGMKIRVWERGSKETLSCGSGACAAATAAILDGRTKRKVNVEMLGGMLEVEWKSDGEMYLTGSCHFICEGDYPCILQETGA